MHRKILIVCTCTRPALAASVIEDVAEDYAHCTRCNGAITAVRPRIKVRKVHGLKAEALAA